MGSYKSQFYNNHKFENVYKWLLLFHNISKMYMWSVNNGSDLKNTASVNFSNNIYNISGETQNISSVNMELFIALNTFLRNIPFRLDSDVTVAVMNKNEYYGLLFNIYNNGFSVNGTTYINLIGNFNYSENNSVFSINTKYFYEERKHLNGIRLRVGTVVNIIILGVYNNRLKPFVFKFLFIVYLNEFLLANASLISIYRCIFKHIR